MSPSTTLLPRLVAALALVVSLLAGDLHAAAEGAAETGVLSMVAKLVNFALLVGVLAYFLKSPLAAYLASRGTQIRQDLVNAAEMRAAAAAQLAEVERRLHALPGELETLKRRGAEDVEAEKARIARAAAAERARLLEHTRREIEGRLRIAKRDLTTHAADLAVGIARRRIEQSMTPDDQIRLVDRYAAQLGEAR
jgi:F-type H+-transporting ATPase subunit b